MSDTKSVALAYPRLSLAYFLQFAVWGSYGFALTGFAMNTLKFSGPQMGWVGAAIPIGALFAPIVGRIADKYMPAQIVLSILQFLCAALLIFAGFQKEFMPMMVALILVGIVYMPTIPLINSIVFKHLPNPDNAPRVFMFGTIGWIFVVLFIQAFFGGGVTNEFFFVGAGCSIILGAYALTLPNTPPNKEVASETNVKAPSAWGMLAQPRFAIFALTILIAGIAACGVFFGTCFAMITQRSYPGGLALTTLNQFSEVLFMAALPIFAKKIGLKYTILLGIAAWICRYVFFMYDVFGLLLAGLLLHGLCYSFLYAASYMYADKMASDNMKASLQSLVGMILLGVGQIGGYVMAGYLVEAYPAKITEVTLGEEKVALPGWSDPSMADSAWNKLDLAQYVQKKDPNATPVFDFGSNVGQNGKVDWAILNHDYNGGTYGNREFSKEEVIEVFRQVQSKVEGKEIAQEQISLTRQQYLNAQMCDWQKIFMIPTIMMAAAFVIFLLFGKNPGKDEEPAAV